MTFKNLLKKSGYQFEPDSKIWLKSSYASIAYSDGDEVEERLARIIGQATDLSVLSMELSQNSTDWPSLYHLSSKRANILRPFETIFSGAHVLEIGAGCGAITRYLGEHCANLIALEGSLRRAAIARSRTRDLGNVEVVADRFNEFSCEHKFDVVTLIGVLEYANLFTPGDQPARAMLERVSTFLKPGGKVVIAIENQLGLKYFSGAPEDHLGLPMYGIEGRYKKNQPQTYGKRALEKLLIQSGLSYSKFMAPFPDYKLPSSIVTEAGFSDADFDASALAWQSVRSDPQIPHLLSFSPELAWPGIFDNGLALDLANSFLVVASSAEIDVGDREILAYHYSTDRRVEYCKKTFFIKKNNKEIKVVAQSLCGSFSDKGGALTNAQSSTESSYVHGTPLSWEFIEIVGYDEWCFEDVANYFKRYLNVLGELKDSTGEGLVAWSSDREGWVKGSFIDATPQNIIVSNNGEFILIDSEWSVGDDIPIARLLFRAILLQLALVTRCGLNREFGQLLSRKKFVVEIFIRLEMEDKLENIDDYVKADAFFMGAVTGSPPEKFMEWWPDSILSMENYNLALVRKDSCMASLNQAIFERDLQITNLSQVISERDRLITNLNQMVAEQTTQIVCLSHDISALLNSSSWRLTLPLRFARHQLARVKHLMKIAAAVFQKGGGFLATLTKAFSLYRREGLSGIKGGIRLIQSSRAISAETDSEEDCSIDYSEWVRRYDTIDDEKRQRLMNSCNTLPIKPNISVVMPTCNANPNWLVEAIESVKNQIYQNWELCIANDGSPNQTIGPILERFMREDARIKMVFHAVNGHISACTNSAMESAEGDWVTLLDHDDLLSEDALFWIAETINKSPDARLIYSDEDKIDFSGERCEPFFKPDWSPHLACSQAYLGHLVAFRRDGSSKKFSNQFIDAHEFDFWISLASRLEKYQIVHISRILYHWRKHSEVMSCNLESKLCADDIGLNAVKKFVSDRYPEFPLSVKKGEFPLTYRLEAACLSKILFSIIIPTKDRVDLLAACVASIIQKSSYANFEIIILDNNSSEQETFDYFSNIQHSCDKVRVIDARMEFNWSRLNNLGVSNANGDVFVFLNNDTEIISPDWLQFLGTYALFPDVAVVGGLLLFEDGSIQHSGVVVGLNGWADHIYRTLPPLHTSGAGFVSPIITRNVLAVTGACMAIAKDKLHQLGGFDESFIICGSDVELCIRAFKAGFYNVMCAEARLYHYESKTRSPFVPDVDFEQSKLKYAPFRCERTDPFFNKNLSLNLTRIFHKTGRISLNPLIKLGLRQ